MMNSQRTKAVSLSGPAPREADVVRVAQRSLPLASVGLRCGAFLLDYILMMLVPAVTISIALLFKRSFPDLAWTILYAGYAAALGLLLINWIWLVRTDGQTLGKRILGIQIVRRDGGRLGYREALLRHLLGYPLSALAGGLGFLWILWDQRQEGWHDKLAGTVVIRLQ